jgi:hypothetical protein
MRWFKAQGHDEHHVVRLRASDENRIDVIALAADSAPMSMRWPPRSRPRARRSSMPRVT